MCVLSYVQLFVTPWATNPLGSSAAAKSLQLCPPLCDPIDGSPPGYSIPGILQARTLEWVVIFFSVHGILQARILEWVAIPFPSGSSRPRDWTHISWISCIGRRILYHCATWEAHSILSIVSIVYKCQFQSPNSSHHPLPPWCPYVWFLHLCLYFCFANNIIDTIFLDSLYMH